MARNSSVVVSGSATVTFSFVKQVLVKLDKSEGLDGSWYRTPAEVWVDEGVHELYAEPTLVQQAGGASRTVYGFSRWLVGGTAYTSNPLKITVDDLVLFTAE